MKRADATRRHVLTGLTGGLTVLGAAALLGGCAGGAGSDLGATSALAPDANAVAKRVGEQPEQAVKVALLLPLESGIQMSLVAKGLQQSAELALFERNVPGFQLIVKDDKGTPEGAAAAANDAIAAGAELILGPLFGGAVAAVAPVARKANIPVIAFSNDPAVGGRGVHLLSFFAATEAARVAEHAVQQGRRHIAALIPDDALGLDTEPAFRQAVQRSGGQLAIVEKYPAGMSGIMEPAQRVMDAIRGSADSDAPIDALFLPSSSDNVPKLVAMLRHQRLDTAKVRLLVTSGWDNPAALGDSRLHGTWLAAPDPGGWRDLSARFGKAYNAMPPRLASLVYDAVAVATAFATQPKGQRFTNDNLMRAAGFAGVDGPIRLTAAGPIERSLAVLEMQAQGLVMVSPAAGFGAAASQPRPAIVDASPMVRG